MFTIKKLSECPLNEALNAWNAGFKGYYFDAKMNVDRFAARLGNENLAASLSIVAFAGNTPAGILLSGVKTINGQQIAWNGGTGVATHYRRKGLGKLMLDYAIKLYQEANVTLATLEAISENRKAISLYEKSGYEIVDEVVHLGRDEAPDFYGSLDFHAIYSPSNESQFIPLYQQDTPWQSQWFCMRDGQTLQLIDNEGVTVAYGLFKRMNAEDGTLKSVVITHCYINENYGNSEYIIDSLFSYLLPPSIAKYQCTIAFLPVSNKIVYDFLLDRGFTRKVTQVWMKKPIKQGVSGGK